MLIYAQVSCRKGTLDQPGHGVAHCMVKIKCRIRVMNVVKMLCQRTLDRNMLPIITAWRHLNVNSAQNNWNQSKRWRDITSFIAGWKIWNVLLARKIFEPKMNGRKHSSIHIREKTGTCRVCGRGFDGKEYLRKHMQIAHGSGSCVFKVCGKRFRYKCLLKRHLGSHSGTKVRCLQYGKSYKNEDSLMAHQRRYFKVHV